MFKQIGPMEIFIVLVVVLIIFGVGKLPSVGRGMGQAIRETRRNTDCERRLFGRVADEEPGAWAQPDRDPVAGAGNGAGSPGQGRGKAGF